MICVHIPSKTNTMVDRLISLENSLLHFTTSLDGLVNEFKEVFYAMLPEQGDLSIRFRDADMFLECETRSKELDPRSPLVALLTKIRTKLKVHFPENISDERPWHIHLGNTREAVLKRVHLVEGTRPNLTQMGFLGDRAFVLFLGEVESLRLHITIAYFIGGTIPDPLTVRRLAYSVLFRN